MNSPATQPLLQLPNIGNGILVIVIILLGFSILMWLFCNAEHRSVIQIWIKRIVFLFASGVVLVELADASELFRIHDRRANDLLMFYMLAGLVGWSLLDTRRKK